ncbi:MAG: miniconductance mechanosensitive channel [Phenylobacterium sp.]|jgi:miniconductance mechanosensitive channel
MREGLMPENFQQWLLQLNINGLNGETTLLLVSLSGLLLLGYLVYFVAKSYLMPAVHDLLTHFKPALVAAIYIPLQRLIRRLGLLVPLVFWLSTFSWFIEPELMLFIFINKAFMIYFYINVALCLTACLTIGAIIYNQQHYAKEIPIKGIIQIIKLLVILVFVVLTIAELLNKTPLYLLSGLGALTAVLLIIFKDTILGLVAGIQIATHRLVAHGDWIEMPKYGADGEVLEVGLHTVKVRNWDNTITAIPTYTLISDSFKNWRNMSASGGRRIKRALPIDVNTMVFIDDKQRADLMAAISPLGVQPEDKWHQAQTNIGLFRCYCESYLRQHPQINQDLTLMTRQLQPNEYGMPVEFYCFCLDKRWTYYEQVQAEIVEHLLASLPMFGLRIFQRPSGVEFLS